jgi:hypothetical protein
LGEESAGAVNRAAENRGEESDVSCEIDEIPARLYPFQVYIDDIADKLEGEETDTDGEKDVKGRPRDMESYSIHEIFDRFGKKVEILKIQKHTNAQANTESRDV